MVLRGPWGETPLGYSTERPATQLMGSLLLDFLNISEIKNYL